MAVTAETNIQPLILAEQSALPPSLKRQHFLGNIACAANLALVGTVTKVAEFQHKMAHYPDDIRWFGESAAHPVVGFAAAWAGSKAVELARQTKPRLERAAIGTVLIGATIGNFATEFVQSKVMTATKYTDFLAARNLPDTAKDYAFALAGSALYFMRNNERAHRKLTTAKAHLSRYLFGKPALTERESYAAVQYPETNDSHAHQ